MAQASLSLATIGRLNAGAAQLIIDQAIREAVADLDDRGDDGKPRLVEIRLSLQRIDGGQGPVAAHVEARAKAPARRTAGTIGKLSRRPDTGTELLFSEYAPEEPDQRTIDEFERGA